MAGFLNNKERIIDFIVTRAGRNQIAQGALRPIYATVTDSHTFYEASSSLEPNVAEDATNRLFFEATERHQDIIVPELTAGRFMQPFRGNDLYVVGTTMAPGTFRTGSVSNVGEILSGSAIVTGSQRFFNSIVQNFKDHHILATKDEFSDTSDFRLNAHTASFVLTDDTYDFMYTPEVQLENIPNICNDYRFKHLPNFQYLPPINVPSGSSPGTPLGNYPQTAADPQPAAHLSGAGYIGYNSMLTFDQMNYGKQNLSFTFKDTSRDNNLICQVFELNNDDTKGVEKLSVIDWGEFQDTDKDSPGKHVYYVGRVVEDSFGATTFIGLFTLVFD